MKTMKKISPKAKYLTYKGYTGNIEFSLTDNCLYGKVLGIGKGLISYEGHTLQELEQDFKEGIDDYLNYCEENSIEVKKPFSGQFSVRLNPDLHKLVATVAQEQGITVNSLVSQALKRELQLFDL
jgi:predicted HicB family RNase H-like nuclease